MVGIGLVVEPAVGQRTQRRLWKNRNGSATVPGVDQVGFAGGADIRHGIRRRFDVLSIALRSRGHDRFGFVSHLPRPEARPADPTDGGLVTVIAERVSRHSCQNAPGTGLARASEYRLLRGDCGRRCGSGCVGLLSVPRIRKRANARTIEQKERRIIMRINLSSAVGPSCRYCRRRLKKLASAVIASRDSGRLGSSQKKCHMPSKTFRSASTPALRNFRCSSTDWLRHMSRVPESRNAGGDSLGISPSSAVAGGSPGLRGGASRPPNGSLPEKTVDSPASSPFIVYRASPGFDPPE